MGPVGCSQPSRKHSARTRRDRAANPPRTSETRGNTTRKDTFTRSEADACRDTGQPGGENPITGSARIPGKTGCKTDPDITVRHKSDRSRAQTRAAARSHKGGAETRSQTNTAAGRGGPGPSASNASERPRHGGLS